MHLQYHSWWPDDQPKEYKHLKRKKRHKNDIKASKQHSLLKILEKSESVSVKWNLLIYSQSQWLRKHTLCLLTGWDLMNLVMMSGCGIFFNDY